MTDRLKLERAANAGSVAFVADRFWGRVDKRPDDCWLWTGYLHKSTGYGAVYLGAKKYAHTHRVAYELAHGPIPSGQCVCHRCDVRLCVNPAHLFLGSKADNARDMDAKGRRGNPWKTRAKPTHCPGGHAYSPENTRASGGQRVCITCARARCRAWWRTRGKTLAAVRRGAVSPKTHCKHGHEFTPANTWTDRNGWRHCRTCRAAAARSRRSTLNQVYLHPDYAPTTARRSA